MNKAIALEAITLLPQSCQGFFGKYIYISIPNNDPTELPGGLEVDGVQYGLCGHNTDLGTAAYADGKKTAKPLK